MSLRQDIEDLFNAWENNLVTGYKISKSTGVSQQLLGKYRDGERSIDRMALETAEKLSEYYNKHIKDLSK